jgi:hypothetical protein
MAAQVLSQELLARNSSTFLSQWFLSWRLNMRSAAATNASASSAISTSSFLSEVHRL